MHSSKVVFAPTQSVMQGNKIDVFLAGSIEMGKATDWQTMLGYILSKEPAVGRIFNPRRPNWDSSWEQSPSNPNFLEQVTWELDHIENADIVFFNFVPGTMSPVTMAEFGYIVCTGKYPIVCCPKDFWRSGNIRIMCERADITCFDNYEESVESLIQEINDSYRAIY